MARALDKPKGERLVQSHKGCRPVTRSDIRESTQFSTQPLSDWEGVTNPLERGESEVKKK